MGFRVIALLVALVAAQKPIAFIFNETYALYGQGAFWDSTWSRIAMAGTTHMSESTDPLFFADGRGLVFTGSNVARLPPHPLDPAPIVFSSKFSLEFWFRADLSTTNDHNLLCKQKVDLNTNNILFCARFKRTSALNDPMIVEVLTLRVDGNMGSLTFNYPVATGVTTNWDRWFHMVISVDGSGASTTGKVYLDGVQQNSMTIRPGSFTDADVYSDGPLFLGGLGNQLSGTQTVASFSTITSTATGVSIYVVKIYPSSMQTEEQVRSAISNKCEGRFDNGNLKFLCDACPANLGKCLFSGCDQTGFQRSSSECMISSSCSSACNGGTGSGYCTSDSRCAACTHTISNFQSASGYYLTSSGDCSSCPSLCRGCSSSTSCHECMVNDWQMGLWQGGGVCTGAAALRLDGSCIVNYLSLPLPANTAFPNWATEFWVYVNTAATIGDSDSDYTLVDFGDYKLTYWRNSLGNNYFRVRHVGGNVYDSLITFSVGKWNRVALSMTSTIGRLMVWTGFAEYATNADFSTNSFSNPVWGVPTQVQLGSGKSNVLMRDFRLWNTTRSDSEVFDSLFKIVTQPPTTLVSYWLLNENAPVIYDYSLNLLNKTLPITRGLDCWWNEQVVQYRRHSSSTLADIAQVTNSGTVGFLQCPTKRRNSDILMFCNEEIRFVFGSKCMPQDIQDINRTVIGRRGATELADGETDPVFDGNQAGLYFSGKSYIEIDPKRQAFQPASETRYSSRQSDSRSVRMPLSLMDFTVEAWVFLTLEAPSGPSVNLGELDNVAALFSIMHTNGHHQFLWYLTNSCVGVSMRSAQSGSSGYRSGACDSDSKVTPGQWTFLAFSYSLSSTTGTTGTTTFMKNDSPSTTVTSVTLGTNLADYIVRDQAPMYLGASVKGTVLGNFFTGYIFEFALSNYYKDGTTIRELDKIKDNNVYSVWFGAEIAVKYMLGEVCPCHYTCLTCKDPRTGLATDCKSCAAPLVLTASGKCEVSCPSGTVMSSETDRVCVDPKAPSVTSIDLRSDYLGLDLTFSVPVTPAISSNNCERIFDFATNLLLGKHAYCFVSSPSVISVIFGQGPTISRSSTLYLNPTGVLKSSSTVLSYAKTGPYSITTPANTPTPTAVLSGADMSPVTSQSVSIDASLSKGGLGQPLSFSWSVVPSNGEAFSSDLQAYLASYAVESTSNSRLTIPASLVPSAVHVVYTVTVKNWLGGVSSLSLDSYHTNRPVPVMYFTQGRYWRTRRPVPVPLQLTLHRNSLVDIPQDYQLWLRLIETNADLVTYPFQDLPMSSFRYRNSTVLIPAFTLQPNKYYQLVLELTSGLYPECNTFAKVRIDVDPSPLVAQIVGGDRVIGVLDSVTVTSTGSIDPDTMSTVNLTYSWTCDLCTEKTGKAATFTSALASTTAGSTAVVTLTVATTMKEDTRGGISVSSEFIIVAGSRPYMFVHRLPNSVHYELSSVHSNYLHSEVYNLNSTIRQQPNVLWTASPSPLDYTPLFSPKKHFLNTVLLPEGLNVPTRQYTLTITLEEAGVSTWAWVKVGTNARPIGCCLTAAKVAGSRNLYLFDAGMHDDPDNNYPLSYQFYLSVSETPLNFPQPTSQAHYLLPSYHNLHDHYNQQFYAIVTDSLGIPSEKLHATVAIYAENPAFTFDSYLEEAKTTFGVTYNSTEFEQFVVAAAGTYISSMFSNPLYTTSSSDLSTLMTYFLSLLSENQWDCMEMKVYIRDLRLITKMVENIEENMVLKLAEVMTNITNSVWNNPNWDCLGQEDRDILFEAISSCTGYFPSSSLYLSPLPAVLETFTFLSLRPYYPKHTVTYASDTLTAKLWRVPANTTDEYQVFSLEDVNSTSVAGSSVSIPASVFNSKPLGIIDVTLVSYSRSPYAPFRLDKYPELLAEHRLDRYEITENSVFSNIMDVKVYDSGLAVQNVVTTLAPPVVLDISESSVTLTLPLQTYTRDEFIYSTCETWSETSDNVYNGEWTITNCEQNATIDTNGVATCKCSHLSTFGVNIMSESNKGSLRLDLNQPSLDPEYDFHKEKNDNKAYMFYMNAVYLLFILWSLHGGAIIMAYVMDRDAKAEEGREEYLLVAVTERLEGAESHPPLPTCSVYWLNEWFLTGLIRSTKRHYTRCARVHILFSKLYVLLLVPGFFYTYYWTSHEAFDIHGYDWGVTVISLICSAGAQGVLAVLSNTRNVPVSIKRGLYIAYFGLWTTIWLAIGFWTAKGTTQTASIWCTVWLLCAFIDLLILDHLYVLVKWGFDTATDYWRLVAPAAEPPVQSDDQPDS